MGESERPFLLTEDECLRLVYEGIANNDPDIWRIVHLVSSNEEWITFDTFKKTAQLICNDHGQKGII